MKILSEDYIRKNIDNLNWECICQHQKMTENFIREMINLLEEKQKSTCLWTIFCFQDVSDEFILEYNDFNISEIYKLRPKLIQNLKNKCC